MILASKNTTQLKNLNEAIITIRADHEHVRCHVYKNNTKLQREGCFIILTFHPTQKKPARSSNLDKYTNPKKTSLSMPSLF